MTSTQQEAKSKENREKANPGHSHWIAKATAVDAKIFILLSITYPFILNMLKLYNTKEHSK